jgi:hypothetical protein
LIRVEDDTSETGGFHLYIGSDEAGEHEGDLWVEAPEVIQRVSDVVELRGDEARRLANLLIGMADEADDA